MKSNVKYTVRGRRQGGQAIAEGAAMMCVTVPIGMLLICAFVNLFYITTYNTKLNLIATEAVKYRTEGLYWLGMKRADADQDSAEKTAKNIAVQLAKYAGIELPESGVSFKPIEMTGASGERIILEQCTVSPTGFKLPFAGLPGFPNFTNHSVTVTLAATPVKSPLVVGVDANYVSGANSLSQPLSTPGGANTCFYFPCYGAIYSPTNQIGGTPGPVPDVKAPMPNWPIETNAVFGIQGPSMYTMPQHVPGLY